MNGNHTGHRVAAGAALAFGPLADVQVGLRSLRRRRQEVARELDFIDAQLQGLEFLGCKPHVALQDVEDFIDGSRGIARSFVDQHERPVGQLQWIENLDQRFPGSAGSVSGRAWGSGALIANDLFLTAGHCFDPSPRTPRINNTPVAAGDLAKLMLVNFNLQKIAQQNAIRKPDQFPVLELLEYKFDKVDYAIVKLGRNVAGKLPGDDHGTLRPAANDLTVAGSTLCIIQYPQGYLKVVDGGPMVSNSGGFISYDAIDVNVGTSGAPILSSAGEIVGVHTNNGNCSTHDDFGQAIGAIRSASDLI